MTPAPDDCHIDPPAAATRTPDDRLTAPPAAGTRTPDDRLVAAPAPERASVSWPTSLGLEWSVEPPGLVAIFSPAPEHRGPPGYLHGGLAATCLDETMASLGFALDGLHTMTATLNLRYRRPVALDGSPVRIEAWRDHPEARRIQKVHGRMILAGGGVAVEATGLFIRIN